MKTARVGKRRFFDNDSLYNVQASSLAWIDSLLIDIHYIP
jgi:hypothetical protein